MIGVITVIGGLLIACQPEEPSGSLTEPTAQAVELAGYAQMDGGSVVVTVNGQERQINFVAGDGACFFYDTWTYAEINEQLGAGKAPGVDQVDVTLQDVTLVFSELPPDITELVVAVKVAEPIDDQNFADDQFTEFGRYPVENGMVELAVDYPHLVAYFGLTHYSVWFQAIGGRNGQGIQAGAALEMRGRLPDGQIVTLERRVCFGSVVPVVTCAMVPGAPSDACWLLAPVDTGCLTYCSSLGLPYHAATCSWGGSSDANCAMVAAAVNGSPFSVAVNSAPDGGCYWNPISSMAWRADACTPDGLPLFSPRQRYCACVL